MLPEPLQARGWLRKAAFLYLAAHLGAFLNAESLQGALHVTKTESSGSIEAALCFDVCRSHLAEINIFQTTAHTNPVLGAVSGSKAGSTNVYKGPPETAVLGPTPAPEMPEDNFASVDGTTTEMTGLGEGNGVFAPELMVSDEAKIPHPQIPEDPTWEETKEDNAHSERTQLTLTPQLQPSSQSASPQSAVSLSFDTDASGSINTDTPNSPTTSTFAALEAENSPTASLAASEAPFPPELLHNETYLEDTLHANDSIDDCHFLSFDEWKKQKETDALENVKNATNGSLVNATFNGKIVTSVSVNVSSDLVPHSQLSSSKDDQKVASAQSEDQGRTYKDKFNYASVDCAATIVKTNSKAKGANSILMENKDSYLLNQCASTNKFVVIELCQDILVDSVVMGNFEFFSSMFKDIRVSVSDRFPTSNWKVLGDFQAQNLRDLQTFNIDNPLIWARYLKLEMLTHFGDEFYCPISLVRVHGRTMMDEFKEENQEGYEVQQNITAAETSVLDESLTSATDEEEEMDNDDECRVVLPLLGLNEFLRDINSTEYCEAPHIGGEAEPTSTKAVTSAITTQESIYKNIMKRLSLLETNATLSLLYVEEQSKLLSTAFSNLERRQSKKFNMIFEKFNNTISQQLSAFRGGFKQIETEAQEKMRKNDAQFKALMDTYSLQLSMLSEELRFQKKISIFNTVIIVCLLAYVIVTRDAYIEAQALGNDDFSDSDFSLTPAKKYGVKRPFPIGNGRYNRHGYGVKGRKKKRE